MKTIRQFHKTFPFMENKIKGSWEMNNWSSPLVIHSHISFNSIAIKKVILCSCLKTHYCSLFLTTYGRNPLYLITMYCNAEKQVQKVLDYVMHISTYVLYKSIWQ